LYVTEVLTDENPAVISSSRKANYVMIPKREHTKFLINVIPARDKLCREGQLFNMHTPFQVQNINSSLPKWKQAIAMFIGSKVKCRSDLPVGRRIFFYSQCTSPSFCLLASFITETGE